LKCNKACDTYPNNECEIFAIGRKEGDCLLLRDGCNYSEIPADPELLYDYYIPKRDQESNSNLLMREIKNHLNQDFFTALSLGNVGSSYVTCGEGKYSGLINGYYHNVKKYYDSNSTVKLEC
jgi:hypothetical protein